VCGRDNKVKSTSCNAKYREKINSNRISDQVDLNTSLGYQQKSIKLLILNFGFKSWSPNIVSSN